MRCVLPNCTNSVPFDDDLYCSQDCFELGNDPTPVIIPDSSSKGESCPID